MGVAGLSRTGLAGKKDDERAGSFRLVRKGWPGGEAVESGSDGGEIVEGEETIGAGAELARGLRSAEKQQAKKGRFRRASGSGLCGRAAHTC